MTQKLTPERIDAIKRTLKRKGPNCDDFKDGFIRDLKTAVELLLAHIEALEADLNDRDSRIDYLQRRTSILEADGTRLNWRERALEADLAGRDSQIDLLQQKIAVLESYLQSAREAFDGVLDGLEMAEHHIRDAYPKGGEAIDGIEAIREYSESILAQLGRA